MISSYFPKFYLAKIAIYKSFVDMVKSVHLTNNWHSKCRIHIRIFFSTEMGKSSRFFTCFELAIFSQDFDLPWKTQWRDSTWLEPLKSMTCLSLILNPTWYLIHAPDFFLIWTEYLSKIINMNGSTRISIVYLLLMRQISIVCLLYQYQDR